MPYPGFGKDRQGMSRGRYVSLTTSMPQREQLASTPEPPLPKGRRQSRQSKAPNDEGGESRWARATPWGERGRSEREHEEERVDYTVKEGRFQGEEEEQARKAFLGEVEGSMSG